MTALLFGMDGCCSPITKLTSQMYASGRDSLFIVMKGLLFSEVKRDFVGEERL